jgi:putative spermidine/putrescine transport system permease protein
MLDVTQAAGAKLEEQAMVLGANKWQVFRYAILPSILPGILSAASLSYILAFMQYFLVYLVGTGKVKTLAVVMFPFLASGDRSIACAFSTVFVGISLLVFFVFNFIIKKCGIKAEVDLYN